MATIYIQKCPSEILKKGLIYLLLVGCHDNMDPLNKGGQINENN